MGDKKKKAGKETKLTATKTATLPVKADSVQVVPADVSPERFGRKGALTQAIDIYENIPKLKELGATLQRSGFFPKYITPDGAVVIIMLSEAAGVDLMVGFSHIFPVNGKASMDAFLMKSIAQARCPGIKWETLRQDDEACKMRCVRPGQKPFEYEYTMKHAQKAGLLGKDNWKYHGPIMLIWRCIALICRVYLSDLFVDVPAHTPEELGASVTMTDQGDIVDVVAVPVHREPPPPTQEPPPPTSPFIDRAKAATTPPKPLNIEIDFSIPPYDIVQRDDVGVKTPMTPGQRAALINYYLLGFLEDGKKYTWDDSKLGSVSMIGKTVRTKISGFLYGVNYKKGPFPIKNGNLQGAVGSFIQSLRDGCEPVVIFEGLKKEYIDACIASKDPELTDDDAAEEAEQTLSETLLIGSHRDSGYLLIVKDFNQLIQDKLSEAGTADQEGEVVGQGEGG